MSRPPLKLVTGAKAQPAPPEPEIMLAELVPQLIAAERCVAALRASVDAWRVPLARKRGVAFIRNEHVRREFGQ